MSTPEQDVILEGQRQHALLTKAKAGLVNMTTLVLFAGAVIAAIVVLR